MNLNSFETIEGLIGKTPMIGVKYRLNNKTGVIYVKYEHYNLTGSIKDRIVLYILREAFRDNKLKQGYIITEATSGNTGVSLSAIGTLLGCKVVIFMPDWMSRERKQIIEAFGAQIISVSREEGGFLKSIELAKTLSEENPQAFLLNQFANINNVKAHEETGREIYNHLKNKHSKIDAFVAGVGTGGTIIGVGRGLREIFPDIKIHPLEPQESPTLSTGYKVGFHRIQGISDDFIPEIMNYGKYDEIVQASDGDAIIMAQKLSRTFGLGVGISSGANLIGAIKLQQQYGFDSVVATVFPDCNKKYLTTDLLKQEPVKDDYLAPKVELLEILPV